MRIGAVLIMLVCAIALAATFGCSSGHDDRAHAQDRKKDATQLRIDEAKAIVKIYEIRLHNVVVNAKEEDVTWANVRETYEKKKKSYTEGAISEKDLRDAKERHDYWLVKDQVKDVQEAETLLDLAKIRLAMVEAGIEVYRGDAP